MGALDWLSDLIGGPDKMSGNSDQPFVTAPNPMPPQMAVDPMNAGGNPNAAPPLPPSAGAPMGVTDNPMGNQTYGVQERPAPPAPPPAQTPPLPPGPAPQMAVEPMNAGGNPSIMPPSPMPTPRPSGLGLPPGMPVPPQQAPAPPPGAPTSAPPISPTDVSSAARAMPPPPDSSPQAKGIIGRALGLDPNREAQIRGSLGAGLKAAGENANKPGLAAFAGSMGSGIEGGKGADDKTTDQQDRFLQRSLASKTLANTTENGASTRDLNVARTKLALAQAQAAMTGKGGKDSVVNSEQQLYLRAQSAAAQDGRLKALKTQADQAATAFGPDSPQAKAAIKAHKDAYDSTVEGHAKALGIDPGKIGKIGKQPGMSSDNPVPKAGLTKEKFDALPPGAYFINPKDGKVLVKKGAAAPGAGANPAASPQQSMTPSVPPTPPTPVTAPAGSRADDED